MMKKDYFKSIIVLVAICLIIAALMAAVNSVTAPIIKDAKEKAEMEAKLAVLPTATDFQPIELSAELKAANKNVAALYSDVGGSGYVVMLNAKGYDGSKPMSLAVGVDNEGRITKCQVISCAGETKGIGTKVSQESFLSQFLGADASLEGVDTISGATVSSKGFISAVKQALAVVKAVSEND